MNKLNHYFLAISLFVLANCMTGCTEEDDYKKFLEGGEIYYPGKIANAKILSGNERVVLTGLFLSDPKVTECLVYWNIRTDSVIIPVTRRNIIDTLYHVLEGVEEGIHNFEFITMDPLGNRSIVVNATGRSYGEKFQNQLLNRPVIGDTYIPEKDSLAIFWASMDLSTGAYEVEVQYNLGSNPVPVKVSLSDTLSPISNYDGSGYRYRTFFRPDSTSIDVFFTDFSTVSTD